MVVTGLNKVKSEPGGEPGEEQKSHLWRSYAVDKFLAKLGLTASRLVNRPLSWPGSEHAGTHPRTKGAPFFPRWAPGLNTITTADDRYCRVEATMVIRRRDQVEHKSGIKFRKRDGSELEESDRTARSESVLGRRWR